MAEVLSLPAARVEEPQTLTAGLTWPWRTLVEALPGMAELNRLYASTGARPEQRFHDRALAALGVTCEVAGGLDDVPTAGPLMVAANHPTGALDGLTLLSLIARRRSDVKILANRWLAGVTPLAGDLLPVDAFGDGRARNQRALRDAVRWVRAGGALCIFPSGAVSYLQPGLGAIADPPWHDGVGRLVRLTGASVVPCFLEGRNSLLFQLAGLAHPWVRTALLPRELVRRQGAPSVARLGKRIPAGAFHGASDGDITRRLREIVYDLPNRPARVSPAKAIAAAAVAREVGVLEASQALVTTPEYAVFWATATQAPHLLQAIGRAREEAFRAAGEGTGGEVDLDRFDDAYVHLCLWDRGTGTLAGAYRMRQVGADLAPDALYTHTLFDFDRRLVGTLAPALELGRAFVAPAHQKRHAPLMLLWTGIARYVAAHAEIRHLFGAVSIGASYSPAARAFLAAYLRRHALDRLRAPLVAPRHPLAIGDGDRDDTAGELDTRALSASVQARDASRKGLPVLLRQYLKLQARVLDFSVDPAFSDVLDALVAIDLPAAPRALLERYMGASDAAAYLARHAGNRHATRKTA